MSSSTISAMLMGAADGDLNYLNSTPIGSSLLDDMGLDEDDFQSSSFEVFIPESYDSKFMSDYEYISKNANRFMKCKSREYAIQGELLKFFIIVRPPDDSKKRQKQQQIQQLLQQKQKQILINQSNTSTPPPPQKSIITNSDSPRLIVSDTTSTTKIEEQQPPPPPPQEEQQEQDSITVLQPSTSSSSNLLFELQLRLASDYEKSTKENQNPLNIIDYNPKHSFVNTEMKNDHISSSKSATSYLRQNTLNVNNNKNNKNQNNNNNNNIENSNNTNSRFIGDVVEVSSPFTFKDTSNPYQKPNFFRLSNGDLVFPIEVPIYIREINEDKLITMVIKINRPKNNRNNIASSDNKLERLIQGGAVDKSVNYTMRTSTASLGVGGTIHNNKVTRTILKNFTLIQPMKVLLQSNTTIGCKNLICVSLENTHPTSNITIKSLDIYLFHVLNMESTTIIDSVSSVSSIPTHRQIGNLVKVNEHYVISNLSNHRLPIELEPSNQYSMVLSVEPSSIQKTLQPTEGFHTKVELSWHIPCSSGQVLSLYELRAQNPPFTTNLMISTDYKSPVILNEKFLVKFNISNLSNSLKNLTINIPPSIIKQNGSSSSNNNSKLSSTNSGQTSDNPINSSNGGQSIKKQGSNLSLNRQQSSTKLNNQSNNNNNNNANTTNQNNLNSSRYIPVETTIQFSELSNKSLLSYEEIQRNSVNLLCLEKSVHIGPVNSKNSISASIEFLPLSVGIFEIQNITLYDSIEQITYSLKEPLQICCVSREHNNEEHNNNNKENNNENNKENINNNNNIINNNNDNNCNENNNNCNENNEEIK